ncbi:MAG: acyl-CoA dehydrogenase family protein [Ardenticatenaceae bacterium]|nr:acyl-CoA dehydrogenase family protein [Ardenticatenaceae bacterium]
MLNFQLDEEQKMLTEAIGRYAEERMRKVFRDADEEGKIPAEVVQAGWELGVLPTSIPEQYGGFGEYSAVTGAIAAEAMAFGDLAITLQVMAPNSVAVPVMLFGTEAQKEAHLPLFCEEQMPKVAAALTEPRIQFDPRHLGTTAVLDNDSYILNGRKAMVPLAATAETFLIYAHEDGKTQAFFVPAGTDGLVVEEREKLMGIRALPTYRLKLENCRIPAENKLGGSAGIEFGTILNHSRVALAATAVGVAKAGYEYAREYAKQRVQFGEPIAHRQSIAFMLAEMAIDVDAARMMVWEAAWKLDRGEDVTQAATVMKHFVDDMAVRVADQALQILGGYGYIREYPVELWLRNARGFAAADGLTMV